MVEPDFQRPTGNYDTWYLRSTGSQDFLKGFERWEEVEGALIQFLLHGPLHWLNAFDLAEPSAGDNYLISLSAWGAIWLGHDVPQPDEQLQPTIDVAEDFTVTLSADVSLAERFRVARFAEWQSSYPDYVYRITQRALKRAAENGIATSQVVDFLSSRCRQTPARVIAALERFARAEEVSA